MYRAAIAGTMMLAAAHVHGTTLSQPVPLIDAPTNVIASYVREDSYLSDSHSRRLESMIEQSTPEQFSADFRLPHIEGNNGTIKVSAAGKVTFGNLVIQVNQRTTYCHTRPTSQSKVEASYSFDNGSLFRIILDERPTEKKVNASYTFTNGHEARFSMDDCIQKKSFMISYRIPI